MADDLVMRVGACRGWVIEGARGRGELLAYTLAQLRVLNQAAYRYLVPNLVGSTLLTIDAYRAGQWGFFILEFFWSLVSAWGLVARRRTKA